MSALVNIPRNVLDWLIPQTCLLCDSSSDQAVCSPCYRELPWLQQACTVCALPLTTAGMCPQCQQQLPSFDRCIAAFRYDHPIGPLINQFKHRRYFRNGKMMSRALVEKIQQAYPQQSIPDCIVPVPLHWRRLLTRGFNQAIFIGQELSTNLQIPITSLLQRTAATPKQQGLDRKTRLKNLRKAFQVKPTSVIPKHVVLVDDVMTTGATAEAASAVLKKAGVTNVDIWVLARTPAPATGV